MTEKRKPGRPTEATEPVKKKTFSLELSIRRHIESKQNQTKYVSGLVRADMGKTKD